MLMRLLITAAAAALALSGPARAASFLGEFWDVSYNIVSLTQARAIIDSRGPDATFQSSRIDYPNGSTAQRSSNTALSTFLGTDAGTLTGRGTAQLNQSVFRFTGLLDLAAGPQVFTVGSDDGFELSIDGTLISAYTRNRAFGRTSVSVDAGTGLTPFQLIYWENRGNTGVDFMVDGQIADPASAPSFSANAAAVPLPGAALLLLGALGALGVARQMRRA